MNVFKMYFIFFLLLSNYGFATDQGRLVNFFKDYNLNAKSIDRLPFAIENGYDDVAEFLVMNGEKIEPYTIIIGKSGDNIHIDCFIKHPLITAIKNGYVDLSTTMIKLISNIDSVNEYKILYLHTVNNNWSRYDIEKLYALQAAIESPEGYPIVEELLAAGVNLNARYSVLNTSLKNLGATPLILSISSKKLDIARLLLEHGADANLFFQWMYNNAPPALSPLYIAVREDDKEAVELLLNYGADPLKKLVNSLSPLELAIQNERWDILNLFLSVMNHM